MTGFLFLGMSYGILMRTQGFHPLYPTIMAMTIFGGSLEYVCVSMLLSAFAPLETLLMALLIQARHLFYGLAMLDKYRGHGWKTPLLIFGMCDESFSINCSVEVPKEIDRGWFYLWVTLLNWLYWISGATIGAQLGAVLPSATFALLLVYCLRNTDVSAHFALPEALGIAVTFGLHLWRRNMLLSIAGGTAAYMLLVQLVF